MLKKTLSKKLFAECQKTLGKESLFVECQKTLGKETLCRL
jgi:hypothetical protein